MRGVHQLLLVLITTACVGCGASGATQHSAARARHRDRASASVLSTDLAQTRPAGKGRAFWPPPLGSPATSAGVAVNSMRCVQHRDVSYGAHLELFAQNRGVVLPAGIGIAQPVRRRGPYVLGGHCEYPLRTVEPTGVVEVDRTAARRPPTVGELFVLWGQQLSRGRLAGFAGRVLAFVDGKRWTGDPRAIPLHRHVQIVLELGPLVQPHASYAFPRGL